MYMYSVCVCIHVMYMYSVCVCVCVYTCIVFGILGDSAWLNPVSNEADLTIFL